jgi:hypothetical protein
MQTIPRRRRRRSPWPALSLVVLVGLVLLLVIGGLAKIGRASGPYDATIDRSFGLQADVLVAQANQTAKTLNAMLSSLGSTKTTRNGLSYTLDSLVLDATREQEQARVIASPAPGDGVGASFTGAFEERASALRTLRAALDGLLGLSSLPVPGAAGAANATQASTLISSADAAQRISGAGQSLVTADQAYAAARRSLRAADGHVNLPESVWVKHANAFDPGPLDVLIAQLTSSSSLAPLHALSLPLQDIALDPAILPTTPPPAVVPPTTTLVISAVVVNGGNVVESGVVVVAEVIPQAAGNEQSAQRKVTLLPGASSAITFPSLSVKPGTTYTLTVSVAPPAGQVDRSQLTQTFTLEVAPSSAPLG